MAKKNIQFNTERCSGRLREALEITLEQAKTNRYEFITPELLLYNIVIQAEFKIFCNENGLDCYSLADELKEYNEAMDRIPENEEFYGIVSDELLRLFSLINAYWQKNKDKNVENEGKDSVIDINYGCISVPDVLYCFYELTDTMANYLLSIYIGPKSDQWLFGLYSAYSSDIGEYINNHCEDNTEDSDTDHNIVQNIAGEDIFRRMMDSAKRLMDSLNSNSHIYTNSNGENGEKQHEPWEEHVTCLNETYIHKNPLIGRHEELTRAMRILCRKDKNNPLFIGEPGVGKTAIIYGLAKMIEEGKAPSWLQDKRIYSVEMGNMVAGASYHGEFEKRIKTILEGAKMKGNCIIYIDEIHNIMETGGGSQSMNAAEILKPYLEDGTIRFIGSTTYQDYNKTIANKKAIARRFSLIDIKEPSIEESYSIIQALVPIYERHHGVKYTEDAIRYAIEQSDNLINDRHLPDKAIDIIDEAGAFLQQNPLMGKDGKPKATRYQKIDKSIIKMILADVCRIDAKALTNESNADLKDLDKRIGKEIYGQSEAIKQVVRSVMMSKAGLMEPNKPIASLLFVGPTGVGKTEVCNILAKELGINVVRFDMSEYTEKHSISKLIGSPAGYVGYDEGGLLTDAIRKTPNCVLLLDEIEKAHSDIYNILLQVMDYARLTDNKGNKADFKNVILIMTSNAGAQYAGQANIGFNGGQSRGQAMLATVKKTFKPEFLNRLSGTVVFNDMNQHMASLILDKKLRQLEDRLHAKDVCLSLTKEARAFLLEKGFTSLVSR